MFRRADDLRTRPRCPDLWHCRAYCRARRHLQSSPLSPWRLRHSSRPCACQLAGANGDTFVRSVVAGYEISNRIGVAINPVHYDYWHTTGTVGTFGAAIASSVALETFGAAGGMGARPCGLDGGRLTAGLSQQRHDKTAACGTSSRGRSVGCPTCRLGLHRLRQDAFRAGRLRQSDEPRSRHSPCVCGPPGSVDHRAHDLQAIFRLRAHICGDRRGSRSCRNRKAHYLAVPANSPISFAIRLVSCVRLLPSIRRSTHRFTRSLRPLLPATAWSSNPRPPRQFVVLSSVTSLPNAGCPLVGSTSSRAAEPQSVSNS